MAGTAYCVVATGNGASAASSRAIPETHSATSSEPALSPLRIASYSVNNSG